MLVASDNTNRDWPAAPDEGPAQVASPPLTVSVVIPVYNAGRYLERCLRAISRSTIRPLECLVIDDGSTDDSPAVADAHGARVLFTGGRTGPAHARNLGAEQARGSLLFFLDADVCVHPDAIARVLDDFAADPTIDGVVGSYDDAPGAQNYMSQFRNLMHTFVHQHANRAASTFWSGCGAVRREVLLAHGGFDESYERPAIEDIELGTRMVRAGHRIVLDPGVQATHLKRWTFWSVLKTDVRDRGIPWTELILRERSMPNDLNLKTSQRVSVALVFFALAFGAVAVFGRTGPLLTPLLAVLFLMLSGYWAHDVVRFNSRGSWLAAAALFTAAAIAASFDGQWFLIPTLAVGWVLLLVRIRSHGAMRKVVKAALYVLYGFVAVQGLSLLTSGPLMAAAVAALLSVVAINAPFYRFIASRRGRFAAGAAIPLHLFHYFYSGISFLLGTARYATGRSPSRRTVRTAASLPAPSLGRVETH